jgi:hypothetical protein
MGLLKFGTFRLLDFYFSLSLSLSLSLPPSSFFFFSFSFFVFLVGATLADSQNMLNIQTLSWHESASVNALVRHNTFDCPLMSLQLWLNGKLLSGGSDNAVKVYRCRRLRPSLESPM